MKAPDMQPTPARSPQQPIMARPRTYRHQRGVTLFVVIVLAMLSMLLALWASRSALFNELIVSNDADYQRAFEAAQALLQDAELDIRGERADGSHCVPDRSNPQHCRSTSSIAQLPQQDTTDEITQLLIALDAAQPSRCVDALCVKRTGKQDFWNNSDASQGPTLAQMQAVGARYGQYTGATTGTGSNPILAESDDNRGGWYWIEILPYEGAAGSSAVVLNTSDLLELRMVPQAVYRITALARGRKANTQVVLQQTYARKRREN